MSAATSNLAAAEVEVARWIHAHVVPVLSEGVVCAMRDQPPDPAAYLAEFLAAKGAGTEVAAALAARKLAGECAKLDAELAAVHEQLDAAQQEAQRRVPGAMVAEAVARDEAAAAAQWQEMRRLKRLMRTMKLKTQETLDASEWLLPEGVLLVQAAPGVPAEVLCTQLSNDFAAFFHRWEPAGVEQLGPVLGALARAPGSLGLVLGCLDGLATADEVTARLSMLSMSNVNPAALVLLTGGGPAADDDAAQNDWTATTLPALQAACRAAQLQVIPVACQGDYEEDMSSLLVAVSDLYD